MYFNHSNNIFEYIYMILIIITEYTVVFPGSSAYRESAYNAERPCFNSWVRKIHWEWIGYPCQYSWVSLVAQTIRNPPVMRETWVGMKRMAPGFNLWVGKIPCRRAQQPTPVFLPGKSHGQRSLVGYTVHRIRKESDTTEWLTLSPRHNLQHLSVQAALGGISKGKGGGGSLPEGRGLPPLLRSNTLPSGRSWEWSPFPPRLSFTLRWWKLVSVNMCDHIQENTE